MRKTLCIFLLFFPVLLFSSVNLGPLQTVSTSGIETVEVLDGLSGNIKNFSVSFKEPSIGQTGQYNSFIVEGCSFTDKYVYQLPVKNISFELPKGASVSSVRIKTGKWQEIIGEYSLPPLKLNGSTPSPIGGESMEGDTNSFLPGTFIDAGYSPMSNKTIVVISVYPVQYNPKTKKAIFLKEAEIEVDYGIETKSIPQVFVPLSSGGSDYSLQDFEDGVSECIIITPAKYQDYANRLKALHENQNIGAPVLTRVITIEEIASKPYGETSQPPLASLPTSLCPEGDFTTRTDATTYPNRNTKLYPRFNSRLAQKIISFLLDCHDAPGYPGPGSGELGYYSMHKLQYIVILGNANEVPPSNYVYSTAASGPQYGTDSYEYWVPTDYFYSACSHQGLNSLNPYTAIGRIPVSLEDGVFTDTDLLTITAINTGARTITFLFPDTYTQDPSIIQPDMTVVIKSGAANGRWLDIESVSYTGPSGGYYTVTLTLRANRNNNEAWLTDPAVAVNDRFDIIDTRPQMDALITKLENWVDARTGGSGDDWFRSVSFAGGTYKTTLYKDEAASAWFTAASISSLFWDELSCVEAINAIDDTASGGDGYSYVAGLDIRKYFASDIKPDGSTYDEAFIRNDIAGIFQNSSSHRTGFLYFAGTNNGGLFGGLDTLQMEDDEFDGNYGDDQLTSDDILGYSSTDYYNIFVISHTYSTGAFDEELWYGATTDNISIGKASLLSGAGAFAFFGPVRSSLHYLSYTRAEDGLLVFSQTRSNELTMNILKYYHRAAGDNVKLSDIVAGALGEYYAENGGSDIYNFRTLIEYHLLGSPCIYIPPPPSSFDEYEDKNPPSLDSEGPFDPEPDRVNSDHIPCYEINDNSSRSDISFNYKAQGPVEIKLVDARYYTADDKQTLGAEGTYTPSVQFDDVDSGKTDSTNGPGLYFIRISQQEMNESFYSKEQRYYFETVNTFTPSGDILVIDDDQPRRYTANSNSPDFAELAWQSYYPDYEGYYTYVLGPSGLNKSYKVWHVENKYGSGNTGGQGRHGEVTEDVLNAYIGEGKAVVWFTGNDWFSTILPNEQQALKNFLEGGGRLFITGQDIGWNIGNTTFYQNVLRATRVQDDIRLFNIDGSAIDALSSGLQNISITGGDGAKNQRYPSEIDPQSGASSCLFYDPYGSGGGARQSSGSAGIKYSNEQTGQAHVYFAFGFEAIDNFDATSNGRKVVMQKVLDWLGSPTSTSLFNATAGDGEVILNWTNPNPTSYPGVLIIYREGAYPTSDPVDGTTYTVGQAIGDGTVIYVQSPAGTSYTHTGLTNGVTYYYKAYVFNASKNYEFLGEDNATPTEGGGPGALEAPTNLMATANFDEGTGKWSIDLSWQDNSDDEDGFEISRSEDGVNWNDNYATVGANVNTYTDDGGGAGLTPGVIYYYRVRAYRDDPGGRVYSSWSNTASAATSEIMAPTNLRAVGGEREVWLTWTNNSPGADGFEIWRSHLSPTSPSHNWVLVGYATPSTAVSYRDSLTSSPNIPDGRPYYYKIRPYKTGVEPEEEWWSDTVWTNPIPSAFPAGEDPINLEVLPGWNTVVVRFDDRTENESSYWVELWRKVPNNTEEPYAYYYLPAFSDTGTQETVLTILTGGKYYLRLIAYHRYGYGFSRYATSAGSSTTYVSFELPEGDTSGGGGVEGTCFIATAAYGTPMAKEVVKLRKFRDEYLTKSRVGRAFVRWYYRHSPRVAEYIRKRNWARALVRAGLRPLLWLISIME